MIYVRVMCVSMYKNVNTCHESCDSLLSW